MSLCRQSSHQEEDGWLFEGHPGWDTRQDQVSSSLKVCGRRWVAEMSHVASTAQDRGNVPLSSMHLRNKRARHAPNAAAAAGPVPDLGKPVAKNVPETNVPG